MVERRVVLRFPKNLIDQPIVSRMVRQFGLEFNILRANITPQQEGLMVLGLAGKRSDVDRALRWAQEQGVEVQPLHKDIVRNEDACTQCGACVVVCPTGALFKEVDTQLVVFDADKCVACEICVPVCPPRAMEVAF